jgi:hypothetical protein
MQLTLYLPSLKVRVSLNLVRMLCGFLNFISGTTLCSVLNGPTGINMLNMMISLVKYGLTDCYGGFSDNTIDKDGWATTKCEIGNSTNYGALTYDAKALNLQAAEDIVNDLATLLTSGRLTSYSRQVITKAFEDTINRLNALESSVRPSQQIAFFEAVVNTQQLIIVSPEFHTTNIPSRIGSNRTVASARTGPNSPYKSVVFLMLSGGADSYNILVPAPGACSASDNETLPVDQQYLFYRDVVAFDASKGEFDVTISATEQPCTQFALHDELKFLQKLYNEGDAIFFANTGVVNRNDMARGTFEAKTRYVRTKKV